MAGLSQRSLASRLGYTSVATGLHQKQLKLLSMLFKYCVWPILEQALKVRFYPAYAGTPSDKFISLHCCHLVFLGSPRCPVGYVLFAAKPKLQLAVFLAFGETG